MRVRLTSLIVFPQYKDNNLGTVIKEKDKTTSMFPYMVMMDKDKKIIPLYEEEFEVIN